MPARLVGASWTGDAFTITERDVVLYALAVGAGRQPASHPQAASELRFVYERHPRFCPLPTLAATLPFLGMDDSALEGALASACGGLRLAPGALLHGEHALALHRPLPVGAPLRNATRVAAALDKGFAALLVLETVTSPADGGGGAVATNTQTVLLRGLGGFDDSASRGGGGGGGGAPGGGGNNVRPPARPADAVWVEPVEAGAALLYRLTGDANPLHADPAVATAGGFPAPVLHGLATLGRAARAVVVRLLGADGAGRVRGARCRFTGPVFPGDLLGACWGGLGGGGGRGGVGNESNKKRKHRNEGGRMRRSLPLTLDIHTPPALLHRDVHVAGRRRARRLRLHRQRAARAGGRAGAAHAGGPLTRWSAL